MIFLGRSIEPSNGTWNFSNFDAFYSNLTAVGIAPLAILDYGNLLIYGNTYANYIPNWMIPAWLQFVNASVTRYQSKVPYWEIWNEPNLSKFWNGSQLEFFQLLNATAILIRQIAPNVKILAPGISGNDPNWLNAEISYFGDTTFNQLFDVLCFHPYSGSNAEQVAPKSQAVDQVALQHHFAGQIWITEVGYSTQASSINTTTQDWAISWPYQATQLVKTLPRSVRKYHQNRLVLLSRLISR